MFWLRITSIAIMFTVLPSIAFYESETMNIATATSNKHICNCKKYDRNCFRGDSEKNLFIFQRCGYYGINKRV